MLSACSFSIVVYCDLGTLCDTALGVHPLLMAAMTRQEYVYVYVHVYVYVYVYVYICNMYMAKYLPDSDVLLSLSAYCLVGYFDIAWILPYTGCATIPLQSMFNAPALHHCVVIRT